MEGSIVVSMRILMGVHGLPPHSMGGAELYALQLAEALAETHHVLLFAPLLGAGFPEGSQQEAFHSGKQGGSLRIVQRRLPRARAFRETWASPAAEQWLAALIAQHQPELLHLHHLTWLSMRLPELAQQAGIPTLLTLHDYWLHCARGQRLTIHDARCAGASLEGCTTCLEDQLLLEHRLGAGLRALKAHLPVEWAQRQASTPWERPSSPAWKGLKPGWEWLRARLRTRARPHLEARAHEARRCLSHCALVLSPSRHLGQFFVSEGLDPARLRILPPSPRPARPRVQWPAAAPPLRLAFVGSVIPAKGLHVVLEALRSLPPEGFALDVVGPSPEVHRAPGYAARCRRLAEGLNVRWWGVQPHEQVETLLEQVHGLVFPSIWEENAPLVLAEARARGLWIVASELSGARERLLEYPHVEWRTAGDVEGWRDALQAGQNKLPAGLFQFPVSEEAAQESPVHPDLLPHLLLYQEAIKFGSAALKKKVQHPT